MLVVESLLLQLSDVPTGCPPLLLLLRLHPMCLKKGPFNQQPHSRLPVSHTNTEKAEYFKGALFTA